MTAEENIVKRVCKELNITQRELAERMGVSQGMPAKWAMEATPPPQWAIVSMNLLLENERMKAKLEKLKDFQSLILGEL